MPIVRGTAKERERETERDQIASIGYVTFRLGKSDRRSSAGHGGALDSVDRDRDLVDRELSGKGAGQQEGSGSGRKSGASLPKWSSARARARGSCDRNNLRPDAIIRSNLRDVHQRTRLHVCLGRDGDDGNDRVSQSRSDRDETRQAASQKRPKGGDFTRLSTG